MDYEKYKNEKIIYYICGDGYGGIYDCMFWNRNIGRQ